MRELSNLILLEHMCGRDKKKEEQIKNLREKLTETQEKWNECNREKIELKDKYHELENKHKNLAEELIRREKCYQERIQTLTKRNQELTNEGKRRKDEIDKIKGSMEMKRKRLKSWESTSTISDVGIFTLGDGMDDQIKDQEETQVKQIGNQEEQKKLQRKEYMQCSILYV